MSRETGHTAVYSCYLMTAACPYCYTHIFCRKCSTVYTGTHLLTLFDSVMTLRIAAPFFLTDQPQNIALLAHNSGPSLDDILGIILQGVQVEQTLLLVVVVGWIQLPLIFHLEHQNMSTYNHGLTDKVKVQDEMTLDYSGS